MEKRSSRASNNVQVSRPKWPDWTKCAHQSRRRPANSRALWLKGPCNSTLHSSRSSAHKNASKRTPFLWVFCKDYKHRTGKSIKSGRTNCFALETRKPTSLKSVRLKQLLPTSLEPTRSSGPEIRTHFSVPLNSSPGSNPIFSQIRRKWKTPTPTCATSSWPIRRTIAALRWSSRPSSLFTSRGPASNPRAS